MAVGNKVGQERSLVNKVTKFLRDARAELRKVTWPNRKELTTYTIVVIAITIIVSLFVGAADWLFSQLFGLLSALGR
ncbi:MAG TPA: preprotein translocase subunit SecE [Firmicutes bacterium]|jgi:preprotein translocase subunit SecE|nr:preprotein translocase subunit SecE [Bacillota bacterium]